MISIPVKKTAWGPVNNVEDLKSHIAKSGQFFGQDLSGPACEFNHNYPCNKTLYQYLGWGLHKGLDIPISTGTEIYAAHDGIVAKTSDSITAGIGVVLRVENKFETVYWHNKENVVKVGDQVSNGQLIANSDNTGYSKGPHLHFELKLWNGNDYIAVDPIPYFNSNNPMIRIIRLGESTEMWLVTNGKRSLIYNNDAFQMIGGNADLAEKLTPEQFNAIPDTGKVLAGMDQL